MFGFFNAFMKGYLSPEEITIQPARKSDHSALSKIHHTGFSHGWSDGDFDKMLGNDSYQSFVARPLKSKKSKPLGFVIVRNILDEAEIITIAISPDARGKGIASQLMRSVIRKLQYDRMAKLFLEVDEANHAAINLYKSIGFTKISEREGYYSQVKDDKAIRSAALVMQLELG